MAFSGTDFYSIKAEFEQATCGQQHWGRNRFGEAGDQSVGDQHTPVLIQGL